MLCKKLTITLVPKKIANFFPQKIVIITFTLGANIKNEFDGQ
jgi:hypothetical protein